MSEPLIQPMPWTAEDGIGGLWKVYDANGIAVLVGVTEDEARFIASACYSHADLLAALKGMEMVYAELGPRLPEMVNTPSFDIVMRCVKAMRDAIAKAEGRS
jgi:hypothetical protein